MLTHKQSQPTDPITYDVVQFDIAIPIYAPGVQIGKRQEERMRLLCLLRDDWRCQNPQCGCRRKLQVHHIIPRSQGGTFNLDNLITLCNKCHQEMHTHRSQEDRQPIGSPNWYQIMYG